MDQENSEMHSEDTSGSPTAMSRTSFTDAVGGGIIKEENLYSLPDCKIKLEIVEEPINDNIATSDPEKLDTALDFEASQSKEQFFIKQEVFENPEIHSDDKESLNIPIFCKNEPTDNSEFICALCKETFTCKDSFEEHSRTHSKPMVIEIKMEVFPCESCHQVFSVESELIQHIQAVHHYCGQCGGDFGSRESLESHQLEHRKDAPCPKKPKLEDMQPTTAEVTSAAGEQEAADSSTATMIDTGGDFEHDEVSKHTLYSNDLCSYLTVKTHTGEKPFSCNVCEKKFSRKHHLQSHILTHTGEQPFSCHVCEKRFSQKYRLISHILTHTGEQRFSCHVCEKKFSQHCHLKTHILTHTGEQPFSCHVCEKRFSQQGHLKSHLLTHTGEQPFSCHVCEKRFSQNCHLKTHILTHTGEKPFSCDVCEKKFRKNYDLKRHLSSHTGETPYICNVCDKKFAQKGSLKGHMLRHTGEKPFSCNDCEKKFSNKYDLNRHHLTHTSERPYACNVCDKKYSVKSRLDRHVRTHTQP